MTDAEDPPAEGNAVSEQRSYRAITARAAVGYLENLGGEQSDEGVVVGPGWRVDLTQRKASVGPTMQLNEVVVEFAADSEQTLESLVAQFSQKAIRAGG